ncbi:2-succinyl-5-enolpyruvyl-6-hydroxy-3-cyclohexene-1-carboxylic-acid synthase [Nitrolancea hollandica]|uniref:2-succinyl-5-enolpyruvyl-6-hydroxy-3-cyclohexene-1-carboxylate synthase n=1 Tax=Nitrolancea hollandica Lb TaxID=1129897 RepID=I4EJL2_9BACT|nr:2-succinyl-5-enolpyruvyl-6-hydroxy-3-cyclohexene-1-carboxylic-acid synthase [Nitrolancea hollandica]CCF84874.1 2-oxoglutarate decarboxylase and 2-succinyl-5-enolpyruvyl-6-hydroxy-3-cyclohexene-1-carboxylic-acid synthase [Nitrolancea hollandica Lb]
MRPEQALYAYVGAFVDELARSGVRHVCLAPGSRSTPLALMVARHPNITLWTHLDERSASFFALGLAKAPREPVALVCTSGTAAANFLPAVIEARYGRVPLLVLTADRPPELRDVGAPQSIDQIQLYGNQVKWFVEVAMPEATPGLLRYVRMLAGRAVATALASPSGPVHLNFPFREPLVPLPVDPDAGNASAWTGRPDGEPYVTLTQAPRVMEPGQLSAVAAVLARARRGLIVCGPQDDPDLAGAVTRLAKRLGFPLLADPLSQVRCGGHDGSTVIDAYDAFLRDQRVAGDLIPDLVVRVGAMPTSKPVLLFLQRYPECPHILVDGGDGWNDPALLASQVIHADPRLLCDALLDALGDHRVSDPSWLSTWTDIDRRTRTAIETRLADTGELFEGRVFAELARLLPDRSTLYVGNSMPVRDLDTFFPARGRSIRFLANRGANGIDGVVSSALGAAVGSDGPLVLVIGDISFYHDMNGLLAAKRYGLNATIVLLNNDGGGIFSFLPQASQPEHFEALFGTPHGLDFRPAAELYDAAFTRVDTWEGFREAVQRGLVSDGLDIIELRTGRDRNVTLHREIWQAVSSALDNGDLECRPSR